MDIVDAKTAREFVASWVEGEKLYPWCGPIARARMFRMARDGQLSNQAIANAYGRKSDLYKARAAAHVLAIAERAALIEAMGWEPETSPDTRRVASVHELWQMVKGAATDCSVCRRVHGSEIVHSAE